MKLYVKESERISLDGERLITVETYKSKPHKFDYIIFTKTKVEGEE